MNDMINNGDEVPVDDYDDNNNDSSNNMNSVTGFVLLIGFGIIVVIGVKCCLAYIQIRIYRRAHRLQSQHNNNMIHRQQLDNQHIENMMSQYRQRPSINTPSSATIGSYTFRQNNNSNNSNMIVKVNEQCVLLNRMTIQERATIYNNVFNRNGNQTILSDANFYYNEDHDDKLDTDIENNNNNNNNHNTVSTAIATATAPPVASPSTTTVQQETTTEDDTTNQTTRNNNNSSIIQIPYNNSVKATTCCTICFEIFKPGMQIVWSSSSSSSSNNNNNSNSNSSNSRNNCQHIFCKQCMVDYFSTIQRTEKTYTTNINNTTNTTTTTTTTTTTRTGSDDDESSGSSNGTENTSGASGAGRNNNMNAVSSVVNDISNDVSDDNDVDVDDHHIIVINPCPVCRQEFVCIKDIIIII